MESGKLIIQPVPRVRSLLVSTFVTLLLFLCSGTEFVLNDMEALEEWIQDLARIGLALNDMESVRGMDSGLGHE